MKYKYKVGDLLTTGLKLYLVEEIKWKRYHISETESGRKLWWHITLADRWQHIKKVN